MNRKEIAEMMEKQHFVLNSESTADKWMSGTCVVIAFVLLCLI